VSTFGTKLVAVLTELAVSLKLPTLLPATLLVVSLMWLISPSWLSQGDNLLLLVAIPVVTVSYLLHALNMPTIRFLEGYVMAEWPLTTLLREFQVYKFFRHYRRIRQAREATRWIQKLENDWQFRGELTREREWRLKQWRDGWEDRIWHERERLEERYPPRLAQVKPTSLGNTILAFELYPQRRYQIDATQLWTRFVPSLTEKGFDRFIEGEKAILDFLVNLLLVTCVVWIVGVLVFARTGRADAGILFGGLPVFGGLVYRAACVAAANWGTTVKAAFDLYRFDLAKALNLEAGEVENLSKERQMWQGISEFLAYGREKNFGGFDYARLRNKLDENWEEDTE